MLPAENRLTDGESFRRAVRRGQRSASRTLVVHLRRADVTGRTPARVGLVVSRAVGPAVIRNRVKRRLRHLLRDRLSLLPPAAVVVVRATPAAGSAPSVELAADLDRCLARLARTEAAKAGRA